MSQQQFDSLVARLERQASRHPILYKLKLGAFASLGYVYIAVMLVALLAASVLVVALLVAGKAFALADLVIPFIAMIGLVLRSLWVTMNAPEGFELKRRDQPTLFAAIDEIRRAVRAPRIHKVLLTNAVNASVSRVPRLGMFGWQKNYLVLGLPLLQILGVDEFRAVLAHEFGHLSGAHGRFGAWIYRIRLGWARLAERLQERSHWGSFLFVPFFEWYAPTFAAYSFVQARLQEYEADRLAAQGFGAAALAASLVRLDLKSRDLASSFWPQIFAAADRTPTPSELPYASLLRADCRGFVGQPSEQLRQTLARDTSTADTHPCLRDRLAALEVQAEVPPPVSESAASALFGPKLAELVAHFDSEWRHDVGLWWQARHNHVTTGRAKLADFSARSPTDLNDDQLFEYATLAEEFDGSEKAFDLYRTLVLERGARRAAKFAYARILLQRGDEPAIRMLDEVMLEVPELTRPSCELIVAYLRSHGRESEAQTYVNRYLARLELEQSARAERETIRVTDKWLPPRLPATSIATLKQQLARRTDVKKAYLVRKKTPENQVPLHVVGVLRRAGFFGSGGDKANRRLIRELAKQVRIAEPLVFIWLNGNQRSFLVLFNIVDGAEIV